MLKQILRLLPIFGEGKNKEKVVRNKSYSFIKREH